MIMAKLQYLVKVWFVLSIALTDAIYHPSIHWDPRNPIFKQNVEINVLQKSKLHIVCPNPASVLDKQDSNIPQEQMYENMWIVNKHEYDACTLNTSAQDYSINKRLLSCNSPLELKYYPLVFRAYSAPGGLEFAQGTKYYFIATSDGVKTSLSNSNGGHCVTSNMKMVIYICNGTSDPKCIDAPAVSCTPQTVSHCPTPSLGSVMSSSVLVQQSSPIQISSAAISLSSTYNALAPMSSAADQCQQASIPDEFFSLFRNQSRLLEAIYNYTSLIPDLDFAIRNITLAPSSALTQSQAEQPTNVTQNCTVVQVIQNGSAVVPACPIGVQAPVLGSCDALYQAGYTRSGIYRIDPLDGNGGIGAYCDQDNGGGGWIIILRRYDGSLNFDRGWGAYVDDGLGDITGEFWMSLTNIRRLTGSSQFTIRFDLEAPDGEKRYAEYAECFLENVNKEFEITVGSYTGDAGDSFSYHNGMKFSAKNNDNDNSPAQCARLAFGGWWYNNCQEACLTGKYENGTHTGSNIVGIQWQAWKGEDYSMSRVEMKIKSV